MSSEYIAVARITSTHGLKGEAKIYPIISPPELLLQIEYLYLATSENAWEKIRINKIRAHKKGVWLLSVDGWNSIEDVELLKGQKLSIPKKKLPELPADSYYIGDLIGCCIKTADDEIVGELIDVLERGSNDLYVIKTTDDQELLLPVVKEFVLNVNINEKIIRVIIPDGLREL